MDIFQIARIILILVFFILGLWYLIPSFLPKKLLPYKWEEAKRNKMISKKLLKMEREFDDKVRFFTFWFQIERIKKQKSMWKRPEKMP